MALAQTTLELFATFTLQTNRNMLISQQCSSGTPTLSNVMVIWDCWVSFLFLWEYGRKLQCTALCEMPYFVDYLKSSLNWTPCQISSFTGNEGIFSERRKCKRWKREIQRVKFQKSTVCPHLGSLPPAGHRGDRGGGEGEEEEDLQAPPQS